MFLRDHMVCARDHMVCEPIRGAVKNKTKLMKTLHPRSNYRLHKDLGFWRLIFAGQEAVFKHEQGATYVTYLLLNPPPEPIHALNLCARLAAPQRKGAGISELVDPLTGQVTPLHVEASLQERGLALDAAETMRAVLRTQNELEALLEDEDTIEPVRREAERELIALYEYEAKHSRQARDNAQRASDAVGRAIKRFYNHLSAAVDSTGAPDPVLRAFAEHIRVHLLLPSGRSKTHSGPRPRPSLAGCFTYEPPAGVTWGRLME